MTMPMPRGRKFCPTMLYVKKSVDNSNFLNCILESVFIKMIKKPTLAKAKGPERNIL